MKLDQAKHSTQWQIQDFPRGGVHPLGGRGPPTRVLFGENVCKNERIGSHRGWHAPGMPPKIRQCYLLLEKLENELKDNSGDYKMFVAEHFPKVSDGLRGGSRGGPWGPGPPPDHQK